MAYKHVTKRLRCRRWLAARPGRAKTGHDRQRGAEVAAGAAAGAGSADATEGLVSAGAAARACSGRAPGHASLHTTVPYSRRCVCPVQHVLNHKTLIRNP
jgi:hypothetical protein